MNPLSILQNTEHNSTEKSAGVGRSVAHRSATKARYEQELKAGVIHSGSAKKTATDQDKTDQTRTQRAACHQRK
jgi:hypothetical protein